MSKLKKEKGIQRMITLKKEIMEKAVKQSHKMGLTLSAYVTVLINEREKWEDIRTMGRMSTLDKVVGFRRKEEK